MAYVCGVILVVGILSAAASMASAKAAGAVFHPRPAAMMGVTGVLWVVLIVVSGDLWEVSDPGAVQRCKALVAGTYFAEALWCVSVLHTMNTVARNVPSATAMDRQCTWATAVALMVGWIVAVVVDGFKAPTPEAACQVRTGYRVVLLCVIIVHAVLFYATAKSMQFATSYHRPLISVMRILGLVVFALGAVAVVMLSAPNGDDAAFQSTLALSASIVVSVFLVALSGNSITSCRLCGRVTADEQLMRKAAMRWLEMSKRGRSAARTVAAAEQTDGEDVALDGVLEADTSTSLVEQDTDLLTLDAMMFGLCIMGIREKFLLHRAPTPAKLWLHWAFVLQARAMDMGRSGFTDRGTHVNHVRNLLTDAVGLSASVASTYVNCAEHRGLVAAQTTSARPSDPVETSLPQADAGRKAVLRRATEAKLSAEIAPFQGSLDNAFARCPAVYKLLCLHVLCGPRRPSQRMSRSPRKFVFWPRDRLIQEALAMLDTVGADGSLGADLDTIRGEYAAELPPDTDPGEAKQRDGDARPPPADEDADTGPPDAGAGVSDTKADEVVVELDVGSGSSDDDDDARVHPDLLFVESLVPAPLLPPRLLKRHSVGGMSTVSLARYEAMYNDLALETALRIVGVQWKAYDEECVRLLQNQVVPDVWSRLVPHHSPKVLQAPIAVLCVTLLDAWRSFVETQTDYVRGVLQRALTVQAAAERLQRRQRRRGQYAEMRERSVAPPTPTV